MADARTASGRERTDPAASPARASLHSPSGGSAHRLGRTAPGSAPPERRGVRHRPGSWPVQCQALAVQWISTRLVMLALLGSDRGTGVAREVRHLYAGWYMQLRSGEFPVGDVTWQYPPGAALVMLAPGAVPLLTYLQAFALLALAADGAVLGALARAGFRRPGRTLAGAWLWVLGLPLLLHLPYARYDLLVTATAVLALLALPGRPRVAGALAGLGAMIKVWPLLLLLGVPKGRSARGFRSALVVCAAALGLLLCVAFRGAFAFLPAQRNRGVEIESLGGGVLQVARQLGWPGTVRYHYGSFEFLGPQVRLVAGLSLLLTGAAFCWLLLWRLRARRWTGATGYDAALAAVLLFTVTSRVISPQYLVWSLGLAAVCLTVRDTTQRPVAAVLLLAAAVTTVEYPLFFGHLIRGGWQATALITVRNGLLLGAAVLSCLRLWRATGAGRARD